MTIGVDTTLLVEAELREVHGHGQARRWLQTTVGRRIHLAIAPQVLAEFIHAATDPARFARPLTPEQAIARSQAWWSASEVRQVYPTGDAVALFLEWMGRFKLERKHVLDTMLAATYYAHGIERIVTSNARDYSIFSAMTIVDPSAEN